MKVDDKVTYGRRIASQIVHNGIENYDISTIIAKYYAEGSDIATLELSNGDIVSAEAVNLYIPVLHVWPNTACLPDDLTTRIKHYGDNYRTYDKTQMQSIAWVMANGNFYTVEEAIERLTKRAVVGVELSKLNAYINSLTNWNSYAESQQRDYDYKLREYNSLALEA